jgi:hypothetical protein
MTSRSTWMGISICPTSGDWNCKPFTS